jgi:hypothetical protein
MSKRKPKAMDTNVTKSVACRQSMLTPPRHLIPSLVCPEFAQSSGFVFHTGFVRLITFRNITLSSKLSRILAEILLNGIKSKWINQLKP